MPSPEITVRRNEKEKSWEVVVDFGIYGRLFTYREDAETCAKVLREKRIQVDGVEPPAGLKKLER